MIYDSMTVNAHGDVTFTLGHKLVAVVGKAYSLGDYVMICKVNDVVEPFYIRVGSVVNNAEEKAEIATCVIKAYFSHLVGNSLYSYEVLLQGILKINMDPYSLNNHITINSKLAALIIKSNFKSPCVMPTTVPLQSNDETFYSVDICDHDLISALGTQVQTLIDTAIWFSRAYENWRTLQCT